MQKDQLHGGNSPFLEKIDTNLFFPGGDREAVRNEIVTVITENVAVITLVGDEGSGKSHLCQIVQRDLTEGYCPVYLPESLESYEDVIRIVAQKLNISLRDQEDFGGTANLLVAIVGILEERGEKLILLFDQAEKIYLATLERIRKMLDQANSKQVRVQVLLSGRNALLDNLQQLSICNFEGTQERHFSLRPLSGNETHSYLNYCMQNGSEANEQEVFSQEATEKIFSMAEGNFRMTNILAEEALQSLSSDTSFLVLLENVGGAEGGLSKSKRRKGVSLDLLGGIRKVVDPLKRQIPGLVSKVKSGFPVSSKDLMAQKEWVIAGGGGLLVILLLLIMVFNGGDEEQVKFVKENPVDVEFKEFVNPPADEPVDERKEVTAKEFSVEEEQPIDVTNKLETIQNNEQEVAETDTFGEPQVVKIGETQKEAQPAKDTQPLEVQTTVKADEPLAKEESISQGNEEIVENERLASQAKEAELVIEVKPVEIIDSPAKVVKKPEVSEEKGSTIRVEPLTSVPNKGKIPVLGGKGVSKKVLKSAPSTASVDKIYARRIVASARWWVGGQDGQYTIQLMALTSDEAEKNLKKILRDKKYQNISNDLYILRRTTTPLSVLVFYGEYKTFGDAKSASKGLPEFLKKHRPYALSVEGAVKKASSG